MADALRDPAGADSRPGASRLERLLLAILFLWSLGLRLWYAAPQPNPSRFWDERYNMWNVASFLEAPTLRPANGSYPTLSWLPHALLLSASERLFETIGAGVFQVRAHGRLTATAYRVCRSLQCLCGAACLPLLFLVGRQIENAWL